MIDSFFIQNIALIKELKVELTKGLNILSGETGAGKSIIIDSLKFVLGDRADKSLIRYGESKAYCEVVFSDINSDIVREFLEEFGLEADEKLIISRSMTINGKNEARVNGRMVNITILKSLVELLIDIHAQHENQSLLNVNNHIRLLDAYGKEIAEALVEYKAHFREYQRLNSALKQTKSKEERERLIDIYNFQIEEIRTAAITSSEEDSILEELSKVRNLEKIVEGANNALMQLENSGTGTTDTIRQAMVELKYAGKYDDTYLEYYNRLESCKLEIEDILDGLKRNLEDIDKDEGLQERLEDRLSTIRTIKKKYGKTIDEVNAFLSNTEKELELLLNANIIEDDLLKAFTKESKLLLKLAEKLHALRIKNGKIFESAIIDNLKDLGMSNARFSVEILFPENSTTDNLTENGGDNVQFLISPNPGEPLKPLAKIASGGEVSRFMLALKNILADLDSIGTLVFDEIDTGISGKIAKVVATKLYDIAKNRQVIVITHLPQIACMGDSNYLIAKESSDKQTISTLLRLDENRTILEIMRLAGSIENSISGKLQAEELRCWANNYKNKAN